MGEGILEREVLEDTGWPRARRVQDDGWAIVVDSELDQEVELNWQVTERRFG